MRYCVASLEHVKRDEAVESEKNSSRMDNFT